ncbi:hypothetical protein [Paraclostridium bifermentans]|uniref:hypothetical protein n=1 Tax=Paraclostridium bifermentans TaxID=1490 RepID=UPI00359C7A77
MNRKDFKDTFEDVPQGFKNRVRSTLNNLPDKEENIVMVKDKNKNKKRFNIGFRKRVLVTLAVTMILGTGVFAAGNVFSIIGNSSNIPTYKSIPSISQVSKDFGFEPKIVKEFSNGYIFDKGYTVNKEGFDEEGNSLGKSKELDFTYRNSKNELSLYMTNKQFGEKDENTEKVENYKGVDIYYNQYASKSVPADYEMTEQDKKDEAEGKYVFSVGSKEVEVTEVKFLSFEKDGVTYSLLAMNNDISKDELVKMACEIIDNK